MQICEWGLWSFVRVSPWAVVGGEVVNHPSSLLTRREGGWCRRNRRDRGKTETIRPLAAILQQSGGEMIARTTSPHNGDSIQLWTAPGTESRRVRRAFRLLIGVGAFSLASTFLLGVGAGSGLLLATRRSLRGFAGTATLGTAFLTAALRRAAFLGTAGGAAGSRLAAGGFARTARAAARTATRAARTARAPRLGESRDGTVGHRIAHTHQGSEGQGKAE